jgi:hypothetical protein
MVWSLRSGIGFHPFPQDPLPFRMREAQFFQCRYVEGVVVNHSCTLPVPSQSGQRTEPSPGSYAMPMPAQVLQFSCVIDDGVTEKTWFHVRFVSMSVLPLRSVQRQRFLQYAGPVPMSLSLCFLFEPVPFTVTEGDTSADCWIDRFACSSHVGILN